MPGRDGTGPTSEGALTGRGLGNCCEEITENSSIGSSIGKRVGQGLGRGNGFRRNMTMKNIDEINK